MYILASASPRRRELLSMVVSEFSVDVADCDETCPMDIPLFERPQFLSELKARSVASRHKYDTVIAADTAVFFGNEMLGKPKDEDEAKEMLLALSGQKHKVITGCTIIKCEKTVSFSVSTEVEFYKLTDEDIDEYIKTGDCYDKAGAYGIQSKGYFLVKGIEGDYFNVVGLPIAELKKHLSAIEKHHICGANI